MVSHLQPVNIESLPLTNNRNLAAAAAASSSVASVASVAAVAVSAGVVRPGDEQPGREEQTGGTVFMARIRRKRETLNKVSQINLLSFLVAFCV